jgi:hypothetical protein
MAYVLSPIREERVKKEVWVDIGLRASGDVLPVLVESIH